jgi:5-methylcytosine-specific restriction endonuclease McrA
VTHISRKLRAQVFERAKGLCEYCQTAQALVLEIQIDHIVPQSAGGLTTENNLCLSCTSCNNAKHAYQTGIDPETGEHVPLFNPRLQAWHEHFAWVNNATVLNGLTPIGRATIERLKINRPLVMKARQRWVEAGWHPPK